MPLSNRNIACNMDDAVEKGAMTWYTCQWLQSTHLLTGEREHEDDAQVNTNSLGPSPGWKTKKSSRPIQLKHQLRFGRHSRGGNGPICAGRFSDAAPDP